MNASWQVVAVSILAALNVAGASPAAGLRTSVPCMKASRMRLKSATRDTTRSS